MEGFLSPELGETNHEVTESCLLKEEGEESQYLIAADDSDMDVDRPVRYYSSDIY